MVNENLETTVTALSSLLSEVSSNCYRRGTFWNALLLWFWTVV